MKPELKVPFAKLSGTTLLNIDYKRKNEYIMTEMRMLRNNCHSRKMTYQNDTLSSL